VDLAQLIALSGYFYTGGGVGAVAVYGVVRAVTPAIGVPLVTAATAGLDRGRLLVLLGAATAVTSAGITGFVVLNGPRPAVIALAGLLHVALGAYRPVTSALVPSLVRTPAELVASTAAAGLLDGVTVLVGPLLAGVLLALSGPGAVLYATVAMLAAAALLAARLPALASVARDQAGAQRESAVRVLLQTAEVRTVTILVATQTFVRGAFNVVVVVVAVEVFSLDDSGVSLLFASVGVGAVVGLPIAFALTGRRLYRALTIGLVLWGMPLAFTAVTPYLAIVLLLFAIIGLGNDLVDLGAFSALPRAVPDHLLPQVFGVFEAVLQLGTALGAAAAGVLLGVVDVQVALYLVGSLLPIAALLTERRLRTFDARLGYRDDEVDLLRRQPMFAVLPVSVLDAMVSRLATVEFAPGETIMVAGTPGDRYVMVADGLVAIERRGRVVTWRGVGEGFGEIALVRDTPRTATARATTTVSARTLDRESFLAALGYDPRARTAAVAVADSRMPP
jgi:predicted MFS family arabinose efflux permease